MPQSSNLGLLFLHALPLDGSMWDTQMGLLPGASFAPTLYGFGNTIEAWASEALKRAADDQLIVVGCSVGGSCALEVAVAAPERVAALVLIGTKARHNPDPDLHTLALRSIEEEGVDGAWTRFWGHCFHLLRIRRSLKLQKTLPFVSSERTFGVVFPPSTHGTAAIVSSRNVRSP